MEGEFYMKMIYFIYEHRNNDFKPFRGKEQVYNADLLTIDADRYDLIPVYLPEKSNNSLRFETIGITVRDYDEDYKKLEPKILERIKPGEDVALFIDSTNSADIEFMFYLKSGRNFSLHIINLISVNYFSKDYRELLRIFPYENCTSICYLNKKEYSGENEDFYENPVFDELESILSAISNMDKTDMAIYDHELKKYVPCDLPEIRLNSLFEFITPNTDRDLCQKLYEYRKEFARKNKLEYDKKPCAECECRTECRTVCTECDMEADSLWYIRNFNAKKKNKYISCNYKNVTGKINGVDRMRINTDGEGIRSLILMAGCPLNCKYCGNKKYKDIFPDTETFSVSGMERFLHCDAIYFEATGGGLTFGGGEPLMQPDFIHELFRKYPRWSVNVQTSLCCEPSAIEVLAGDIDRWYVDIKDMDPDIYKSYTGMDIWTMLENLKLLSRLVPADRITVRVPLIENYNTENDVRKSVEALKAMGFTDIEKFRYTVF